MLICPKCKSEYREGFERCSYCDIALEEIEKKEKTKNKFQISEDNWVILKRVSEGYERDSITSLLKDNNIPYLEKRKGSGQYLKITMGMNTYGVDIYVPESKINESKDLIEFLSFQYDNSDHKNKIYHNRKKDMIRGVIIFVNVMIIVLFVLIYLVNLFRG